jgi:hypothetical protein
MSVVDRRTTIFGPSRMPGPPSTFDPENKCDFDGPTALCAWGQHIYVVKGFSHESGNREVV